jgi:hypothetical protein
VAVLQISKIQVRRGQKLSGIGVPQLSSAEFAWAVDTQELFIGNGSIAEGAPAVGNTKILTEHDNIFELLAGYRFGNNNSLIYSVERPIQNKLDEYVSVADFGAIGDGSTDCTQAFTNAFNELFRSTGRSELKKTLMIPNGEYVFTSGSLFIPSTAKIKGETQDGSVLNIGNRNIFFITEDGSTISTPFTSSNRPNNIDISNLTIRSIAGQMDISGVTNSRFERITFTSDYVLGQAIAELENESAAVTWENTINGTKVTGITFKNCKFESVALGLRSNQVIVDSSSYAELSVFDTFIDIIDCKFFSCDTAIVINGTKVEDPLDPTIIKPGHKWIIDSCLFEEISQHAFKSDYGIGTLIRNCKFINCGNTTNETISTGSIVYFGDKQGNSVLNCSSDRHQKYLELFFKNELSPEFTPAIVEVENSTRTVLSDLNYQVIRVSDSFQSLSVFGAYSRYIILDYSLSLGLPGDEQSRVGQLVITVDGTRNDLSFTDNYSYSSELSTTQGGLLMTGFEFNVLFKDNDSDSGIETILVSYKNPSSTGATGSISYSITYGV